MYQELAATSLFMQGAYRRDPQAYFEESVTTYDTVCKYVLGIPCSLSLHNWNFKHSCRPSLSLSPLSIVHWRSVSYAKRQTTMKNDRRKVWFTSMCAFLLSILPDAICATCGHPIEYYFNASFVL